MKLKLLCSIIALCPVIIYSQTKKEAEFPVAPYINGVTTIKDAIIEIGPEFRIGNYDATSSLRKHIIRISARLPLTDKQEDVLQIDRFTSSWRVIGLYQFSFDPTAATGFIQSHNISISGEYGYSDYKYYPTGNSSGEVVERNSSFGFELKYRAYLTQINGGYAQVAPQGRIRYSYDWKPSDKVGVVMPPDINGVTSTTDMTISKPKVSPTFSLGFAVPFYPGWEKVDFITFAPSAYYDFIGMDRDFNPFNSTGRLRLEFWTFYHPFKKRSEENDKGNDYLRIGASPFMNIRTHGSDKFNVVEYGVLITVKFFAPFYQFL